MSKAHHDQIMRIMRLGRTPGRELASFCPVLTRNSRVHRCDGLFKEAFGLSTPLTEFRLKPYRLSAKDELPFSRLCLSKAAVMMANSSSSKSRRRWKIGLRCAKTCSQAGMMSNCSCSTAPASKSSSTKQICQAAELTLTDREYTVAAFKLGISLSAATSSKKVGLVDPSPPSATKDMLQCLITSDQR